MPGLLVHEWIESTGGAEKVLRSMASSFPNADVLSLWNDDPTQMAERQVFETWLSRTRLRSSKALALPFMIPTWRSIRLQSEYEWILASSHLFAHTVKLQGQPDVPKYVYAHTPARYIWTPDLDSRGNNSGVRLVAPVFKCLDRSLATEPVGIAANSHFVKDRIGSTWKREAQVIYPPVNVRALSEVEAWSDRVDKDAEKALIDSLPEIFVLGVSRFIPYKKLDSVIGAAAKMALPVVLAGNGPELRKLQELAANSTVPVRIIQSPSNELLYTLMQRAAVLIFPPVEDFGIVPVEAQALGTPVVTGPIGGQTETFSAGLSGQIAESFEPSDLAAAASLALDLDNFDGGEVTRKFSEENFKSNIRAFVGIKS